jgi:hypothetical protein
MDHENHYTTDVLSSMRSIICVHKLPSLGLSRPEWLDQSDATANLESHSGREKFDAIYQKVCNLYAYGTAPLSLVFALS